MSLNLRKIDLRKHGDSAEIPVKNLHCQLLWTAPVDLDFHAYYLPKKGMTTHKKGLFGLLGGGEEHIPDKPGLVYFGSRGNRSKFPFIYLDKDAGVGDVGGENEENLYFEDLSLHEHILIVANIFSKPNSNFAKYDGKVVLKADDQEITVPLTSEEKGSYCIIAHIDNSSGQPRLININKTQKEQPDIMDFLR